MIDWLLLIAYVAIGFGAAVPTTFHMVRLASLDEPELFDWIMGGLVGLLVGMVWPLAIPVAAIVLVARALKARQDAIARATRRREHERIARQAKIAALEHELGITGAEDTWYGPRMIAYGEQLIHLDQLRDEDDAQ